MNPQALGDDWPLIDPDRDVIGLPGILGTAHPAAGRVQQAHGRVVAQMVREKVLSKRSADAILLAGFSVLHGSVEQEMHRRIMVVFGCLEHIARTYPHDEALRDYLDLPPVMWPWVSPDLPDVLRRVDVCRLDLLGERLGGLRVLEFNANSPGGFIRHGLLARLWRQDPEIADLLDAWQAIPAPFEQPDWFVKSLLALGAHHGLTVPETHKLGLFHNPSDNPPELAVMEDQMIRAGRIPVLLDPSVTAVPEDIRLGYLKYSPRDILRDVGRWEAFGARISSGQLVVPNPLAGRLVAENKRCLAVMSDPRFQRLFTAPQRQALDALVPWSRKLGDGISIADAVADQQDLVLKAPYDSRGRSVYLGCERSHEDWSALLRAPSRRGWLVQRYVPTPQIDTTRGPYYRDLSVWIVGGTISGYSSKIGQQLRLNVARGSAVQTVFGRRVQPKRSSQDHSRPG